MGNIGETVTILAVETSCDETAAAVVENGREVQIGRASCRERVYPLV